MNSWRTPSSDASKIRSAFGGVTTLTTYPLTSVPIRALTTALPATRMFAFPFASTCTMALLLVDQFTCTPVNTRPNPSFAIAMNWICSPGQNIDVLPAPISSVAGGP
jgi:hypothetical protein